MVKKKSNQNLWIRINTINVGNNLKKKILFFKRRLFNRRLFNRRLFNRRLDIENFIMYELGQPIRRFDLDKIKFR